MGIVPGAKPQKSQADIIALVHKHNVTEKVCVVGIRGYYRDTMGKPGVNDRGLYDDALFIVGSDGTFASFNANTDPSSYRKGKGTGSAKGMATLKAGLYHAHGLGLHRGQYMALVQTMGNVTVVRDGSPDYEDTGYFGINIHKGGYSTTSSLGCQTLFPDQWAVFIGLAQKEMHAYKQAIMPYLLVDNV